MSLLALDTSTFTASVALLAGDRRILRDRGPDQGAHSGDLLDLIGEVMREGGVALADLSGIAVGAGPGSFTGLRIAMATAKGLAFSLGKPLWAVSSLAALAQAAAGLAPAGARIVPLIDARRGEVFVGGFRADRGLVAVDPERVATPAALIEELSTRGQIALCGDGLPLLRGALAGAPTSSFTLLEGARETPSALAIAELCQQGHGVDALRAGGPVYLRAAAAEDKFPTGSPGGVFTTPKPR